MAFLPSKAFHPATAAAQRPQEEGPPRPRQRVFVALVFAGRVYCSADAGGLLELPGGPRRDDDKSAWAAARREFQELAGDVFRPRGPADAKCSYVEWMDAGDLARVYWREVDAAEAGDLPLGPAAGNTVLRWADPVKEAPYFRRLSRAAISLCGALWGAKKTEAELGAKKPGAKGPAGAGARGPASAGAKGPAGANKTRKSAGGGPAAGGEKAGGPAEKASAEGARGPGGPAEKASAEGARELGGPAEKASADGARELGGPAEAAGGPAGTGRPAKKAGAEGARGPGGPTYAATAAGSRRG